MNNLTYSYFTPKPNKFTSINYDIKSCPTHGFQSILTTNDGNKTQMCTICNWIYQHTDDTQSITKNTNHK
jgi:hypothetical protein